MESEIGFDDDAYLLRPFDVVDSLFRMVWTGRPEGILHSDFGVFDHFNSRLSMDTHLIDRIPRLSNPITACEVGVGRLVALRCMIQSQDDLEYFVSVGTRNDKEEPRVETLKFRDLSLEEESSFEPFGEDPLSCVESRGVYLAVARPGESPYFCGYGVGCDPSLGQKEDLGHDEDAAEQKDEGVTSDQGLKLSSKSIGTKRVLETEKEEEEDTEGTATKLKEMEAKEEMEIVAPVRKTRRVDDGDVHDENDPSKEFDFGCGFTGLEPMMDLRTGFLLKRYESSNSERETVEGSSLLDGDAFKIGGVYDVIGILSAGNSPSLPVIHVIRASLHNPVNLFVPSPVLESSEGWLDVRSRLMSFISSRLFGDKLAAEYLLFHLLSTSFVNVNQRMLGHFHLNLISSDNDLGRSILYSVLQPLLPASVGLDLTIEHLNSGPWFPRKDHVKNILECGCLQVGDGTHIVFDECHLDSGKLSHDGVRNFQACGKLLLEGKLFFDFEFSAIEMDCNVPVLIVSCGNKSILWEAVPSIVRCVPNEDAQVQYGPVSDEEICLFRNLLCLAKDLVIRMSISEEVQSHVEKHFVRERKEGRANVESLHRWLTLARYVAASYGCEIVRVDHWLHALALESQRLERF